MSHSRRQTLARQRMLYTGETFNQARHALERLDAADPPVPNASPDQAALEAALFQELGQIDHSLWQTGDPAFGITSITPQRDELVMRIAKPFLPDVIAHIMPTYANNDSDQIYGVPGLRARKKNDHIVLYRPDMPGRIRIPVRPADWDKAAIIGFTFWWENTRAPWLTSPTEWHPAEKAFVETYPKRWAFDNVSYRNSGFISGVLRRVHTLHGPHIDYWKMWVNGANCDTCDIQLLWANGGEHVKVIDWLREPTFGLNLDILLPKEQLCRCGPDEHCYIKLIQRDTGHKLCLRRSTEKPRNNDDQDPIMRRWTDRSRQRHERLCATYGY
ncbi:hypothetical protein OHA77_39820 [Streptosporangium sp. NBC_01639]|uniref:hypothetical protein n=1 Tax=Streptosporangium sp. NBC_01639 TaxID=2975948 RepID=UPI00386A40FF|nr:hypothetical protein OHA77_39820 [Streptosporangium sp. NBC_01639]